MASVESFIDQCRTRGIKLTGQRRVIARVMVEERGHPNAEQIHEVAAREFARISLATVYRTLALLRDAGMVIEHAFPDGRCHYELAGRPHHDHLIDAESGTIVEFCDPEIELLQEAIARRLGYRLTGHRLELYGVRSP
ncbi:MAG: transcriptional repressor [Pelagibacterium sp. SCN 63-23]|nr:MAG: transcriptional repressor [Pelagibacterium sp. SCN 63-23]